MTDPRPLPESPCVRNCCLDDADVCLGCGRHFKEITGWQLATEAQRHAILALAQERRAQRHRLWQVPGRA